MPCEAAFRCIEPMLEQLWRTLCRVLSPAALVQVCFPCISTWLVLFMHPVNQHIDPAHLIGGAEMPNESMHVGGGDQREYLGSSQLKFEDRQTRELVQIKCRMLAARLLATLFDRISTIDEQQQQQQVSNNNEGAGDRPINVIINFLAKQINYKSGVQRFCFALLMIEWAKIINNAAATTTGDFVVHECASYASLQETIKSQLGARIVSCLEDENTIYFDEIAVLFTRLQKECRTFLGDFAAQLARAHRLDVADYLKLNVFTFDDVNALTARVLQATAASTGTATGSGDPNADAALRLALDNLIESSRQASQEQESLALRSCFSLASASVRLNSLCERMNPLIRPLIDCLRFESNADLQLLAAHHLALLLPHCARRSPNPIAKIFKNLLNYLCNDGTRTPPLRRMSAARSPPDNHHYDINRLYGILSDPTAHLAACAGLQPLAGEQKLVHCLLFVVFNLN